MDEARKAFCGDYPYGASSARRTHGILISAADANNRPILVSCERMLGAKRLVEAVAEPAGPF
jgi:hypothetical protein